MKQKITIVGFGKLGRALDKVLAIKKDLPPICVWDVVETGDPRQVNSLREAIKDATVIFLIVPSKNFPECVGKLGTIDPETTLVSCTKGLAGDSGRLPFQIVTQAYPRNTVGVISGPMLSEELEEQLPTKATIASNDLERIEAVVALFRGTTLTLEKSSDLIGTSLLGILKNVYALALGLSDGLNLGSNFKSCLALQALREISLFVTEQGGKVETMMTPAGLADFLTTGYSSKSRNYTYGFKKAQGQDLGAIMAEGAVNIGHVVDQTQSTSNYPLLNNIKGIFLQNKDPRQAILQSLSML